MSALRICITAILALAAGSSALAAVAAHGGRFSLRLDVLTHFAPVYLAVGLIAALGGLALGRAGLFPVVVPAFIAIAASVALIAPEFVYARAPMAKAKGATLTIVQFNAWGGNRKPTAAADWLLAQNADVIVMEEGHHIGQVLVSRGGYQRICGACSANIYSRLKPIADNSPRHGDHRRRPFSAATLVGVGGPFTVMGVHRAWPTRLAKQRDQAALLQEVVAGYPRERLIIAGDFNSTPWSFARRREDRALGLVRRTRALFTWPAERVSHNRLPALFPILPIDHVYAGSGWATVAVRRGPRLGSDHYPVVVTLAPAAQSLRTSR